MLRPAIRIASEIRSPIAGRKPFYRKSRAHVGVRLTASLALKSLRGSRQKTPLPFFQTLTARVFSRDLSVFLSFVRAVLFHFPPPSYRTAGFPSLNNRNTFLFNPCVFYTFTAYVTRFSVKRPINRAPDKSTTAKEKTDTRHSVQKRCVKKVNPTLINRPKTLLTHSPQNTRLTLFCVRPYRSSGEFPKNTF